MKIINMTMRLSPEELDTLGNCLEESIRNEFKSLANTKITTEYLACDEIKLLRQFTMYGYETWINPPPEGGSGYATNNVDKWLESLEKEFQYNK